MKFFPVLSHPSSHALEDLRAQALGLAIVLRNCALCVDTSAAGRRACRFLMRRQAIQWRTPVAGRPFVD